MKKSKLKRKIAIRREMTRLRRDFHHEMTRLAGKRDEDRQIPLRRAFGYLAGGIERGAMAMAIEGLVRFRSDRALSMRAYRGKRLQLLPAANDEKSRVAKIRINPVLRVIGDGPSVNAPFAIVIAPEPIFNFELVEAV